MSAMKDKRIGELENSGSFWRAIFGQKERKKSRKGKMIEKPWLANVADITTGSKEFWGLVVRGWYEYVGVERRCQATTLGSS